MTVYLVHRIDDEIALAASSELTRQLQELRDLDDDWADDHSLAPTDASLEMTMRLLPALSRAEPPVELIPNMDGHVVVTQRAAGRETRVELRSAQVMAVTQVNLAVGEAWSLRAPFSEQRALSFLSFR